MIPTTLPVGRADPDPFSEAGPSSKCSPGETCSGGTTYAYVAGDAVSCGNENLPHLGQNGIFTSGQNVLRWAQPNLACVSVLQQQLPANYVKIVASRFGLPKMPVTKQHLQHLQSKRKLRQLSGSYDIDVKFAALQPAIPACLQACDY